ncbi:hypothetical protein [Micromonospora sp. RV43]|uniref:hypothetical protein n=1 Tax=Micromonospora sp. RV43 TaxID=1661387 RepID=UPI00064B8F8D|nr:hypothetical protein [Micromonospora sp. RV43]
MADLIALYSGDVLQTHDRAACHGQPCCIHNPSEHHMRQWPLIWRGDRRFMERQCPHGIGHPDPDDRLVRRDRSYGLHGCDGCCSEAGCE